MRSQKTSNNRVVNARSVFNWSRVRWMVASVLACLSLCLTPHLAQAQGRPDIVWQGTHNGFLRYTTFSPDSQQLASGGDDKTNKLWQASNGSLVRSFAQCGGPGCGGPLFGFYSPDSQTLATSGIKF